MEMIKVVVSSIVPYEKNPRKNDKAVKEVAESIKQCGYSNPIIVDENMVVLCGHTRLKALKKLGYQEIDVIKLDGLTEEQKKKYRIYDNKTAEFAQWDAELLAQEMEDLDFSAFDLNWDLEEADETESYAADLSEYGDDYDEEGEDNRDFGNEEFTDDDFSDETFKYRCPECGFMFG